MGRCTSWISPKDLEIFVAPPLRFSGHRLDAVLIKGQLLVLPATQPAVAFSLHMRTRHRTNALTVYNFAANECVWRDEPNCAASFWSAALSTARSIAQQARRCRDQSRHQPAGGNTSLSIQR